MNNKYKLAVLISHPIQYHSPVFRALAKHSQIDLTVYYCWDFGVGKEGHDLESGAKYQWDIPLLEGYRYKFLKNYSPKPSSASFFGQINPGIVKEILAGRYDGILVHGYSFLTDWLAFLTAFFVGTPIFFRGIAHLLDPRPWYVNLAKRIVLPILFLMCRACLYIGIRNKEYYKLYGVPERKLFHTPHVVDNSFFERFYKELHLKRTAIRKKFGFTDSRPVILFLSRLVSKKRPMWLLDAYKEIRKRKTCGLIFAGEGPVREEMEKIVSRENVPDVVFTGFLNQTEISGAYVASDVFVLPSLREETWGLVVNEAMNFGLPIVVSDKVGCAPDLVHNEENGFVISSPEELSKAIEKLVTDEKMRMRFGKRSKEIISLWDIDRAVSGILDAFKNIKGTLSGNTINP